MAGRYRAILIGNSTYPADEHNLQALKGPVKDIAALNRALIDRVAGLFDDLDVTLLAETNSARAVKALGRFFGSAERDDVLLLYFSGHGKLDQSGRLHLCMQDTETTDLLSTAVSSVRINEFVEGSRARNVIIILDCCYAGAYRGGDFGDAVAGPGRYVLTSCRGSQLANDATVENSTSYFTHHLVEGLLGAAADRDQDGYIDFSDLYGYVDHQLREEGKQIPQRRVIGDGDLRLARRERVTGTPPPIEPPERVAAAELSSCVPPASADGPPASRKDRISAVVSRHRRATLLAGLVAFCVAAGATFIALQNRPNTAHDATDLNCDGYDDYLAVHKEDGGHTSDRLELLTRTASPSSTGTRWAFRPGHAPIVERNFSTKYRSLILPGDLTGDGQPDVVGQRADDDSLWSMPGVCGKGTFQLSPARPLTTDTGQLIIDKGPLAGVGDLTGDNRPDLVSVHKHKLFLYRGTGTGQLRAAQQIGSGWRWTAAIPAGDVNGDGHPDLLDRRTGGSLYLFLSNGHGALQAAGRLNGPELLPQIYPAVIGGVHIYRGSQPDLTAISDQGNLVVFPATGSGPPAPYKGRCSFGAGWTNTNYLVVANAVPIPGKSALAPQTAKPTRVNC